MFQVQILGASAAIPTNSRRTSAQVVTYNDRHHLVDCGEGTQMQMLKYKVKFSRLDAIFISHLHGDHVLGLPGLLTSMSLYGRNFPLKLYAPAKLKEVLDLIFAQTHSYLAYELEFFAMEDFEEGAVIYETKYFQVKCLPLDHRIFCRGFHFSEINKKSKFDFYKAKELGIPNNYFRLLKQGNDVTLEDGRVISPDAVLNPPDRPTSYAYCSDTAYSEKLINHLVDTTLIYHEATFMDDMKDRAAETRHSTTSEAATIAKKANAKQLILGHFSARYKELEPLLEEAQAVFPQTDLAIEGRVFNVKSYGQ